MTKRVAPLTKRGGATVTETNRSMSLLAEKESGQRIVLNCYIVDEIPLS
jgi:hypothetical protein